MASNAEKLTKGIASGQKRQKWHGLHPDVRGRRAPSDCQGADTGMSRGRELRGQSTRTRTCCDAQVGREKEGESLQLEARHEGAGGARARLSGPRRAVPVGNVHRFINAQDSGRLCLSVPQVYSCCCRVSLASSSNKSRRHHDEPIRRLSPSSLLYLPASSKHSPAPPPSDLHSSMHINIACLFCDRC